MNIYSQNLVTESTLEDLIAGFNTGQAYGNAAANLNCVNYHGLKLETRLADLEQSSEKRIAELETRVQKLEAAEEAAIFLYNLFSTNGDDTEVKSWLSNSGIPWTIYNHNK